MLSPIWAQPITTSGHIVNSLSPLFLAHNGTRRQPTIVAAGGRPVLCAYYFPFEHARENAASEKRVPLLPFPLCVRSRWLCMEVTGWVKPQGTM